MKEEAKRWMRQADSDLRTSKYLFEGRKYKEASFFCQQSVEKALKAVLLQQRGELLKTHDLVRLGREAGLGEPMLDGCERLGAVYVDARYPDAGSKEYTKRETTEDIRAAGSILRWARKNL